MSSNIITLEQQEAYEKFLLELCQDVQNKVMLQPKSKFFEIQTAIHEDGKILIGYSQFLQKKKWARINEEMNCSRYIGADGKDRILEQDRLYR